MDSFALQAANRLVGNAPGAAALEVTAGGLILRALTDCLIAVGGGDLGLHVNGWPHRLSSSAGGRRGDRCAAGDGLSRDICAGRIRRAGGARAQSG